MGASPATGTSPAQILGYLSGLGLCVAAGSDLTVDHLREAHEAGRPALVPCKIDDGKGGKGDGSAKRHGRTPGGVEGSPPRASSYFDGEGCAWEIRGDSAGAPFGKSE